MEKTGLREGALFEVFSLNTVARSFRPPVLTRENVGWTGPNADRNRGLLRLPPNPVAGILEDHADRRESGANSIRGGEVLSLAGVLAERNNQVEKAVHEVRALRSRLEDAEDLAERLKRVRGVVEGVTSRTRFDRLVHRASILEDGGDRLARVEIVRHCRVEVLECLRRPRLQGAIGLPGKIGRASC